MNLISSFYYPVVLHESANAVSLLAPIVEDLPVVPDVPVVILPNNRGARVQGLYAYRGRCWIMVLPLYAVSQSIIRGDVLQVYSNLSASVPVPAGSILWANGGLSTDTEMDPGQLMYLLQTPPAASGGGGSIVSVNGQTGVVLINATNLPGLADVGRTGSYNDLVDTPAPYALPAATAAVLGGVKAGAGVTIAGDGTLNVPEYTLQPASALVLGGVRVGSGLAIDGAGVLSNSQVPYELPAATASDLGGVKAGSGVAIAADGTLSVSSYVLPAATTTTLGGVKAGTNVTIAADGTISAQQNTASAAQLGVVRVGSGLAIDGSGILSATATPYTLPAATTTTRGGITVGSGLNVDAQGVLSAAGSAGVTSVNAKTGAVTITGSSGLVVDNTGANVALSVSLSSGMVTTALGFTPYNATNPSNYISANQTITVSGDATATGTTALNLVLANSGVTAGTYRSVTVDAKGRVTAGTNPTTLAGYGITDALNSVTGGSVDGPITMTGGSTVTGLPTPVANSDAASKDYVDTQVSAVAQGVSWKQNARLASTANITLNGNQTVDGVATIPGDRVLVKNQTDITQNGVYIAMPAANDWVRAPDVDIGDEIRGMAILVLEGSTNALSQWVNTNSGTVTIGTTEITYTRLSGSGSTYTAGAGLALTGAEFSIAPTGVTAGTYAKVTVNALGQVTASAALASADITTALGFAPYNSTNPSNYISANQTITVSGDATGSGTTAIPLTLANSGVTAGTYRSVTVDAKGRVTAGTNPTTLAGYGITNALANTGGSMSGSITFTSGTVTGLPTPVASSDAVTKAYADAQLLAASQNAFWKQTVQVASTGNLTQSGLLVVDGYQTVAGDRVLVKDQTNGVQNGIWIASNSAWSRAADSLAAEQLLNQVVLVLNGTVGARTQWVNTNSSVTVGSTSLTYAQTNAAGATYTAGTGLTLAGNIFSITNTGVTAGQYTKVTVNAQGQVTAGTLLNSADVVTALTYTPVNRSGDTMQGALNFAPRTNVASSATPNIGASGSNNITITGTTTITSFDVIASGAVRNLIFAAALTLTHDPVSLILPTGSSILTAAGDTAVFLSLGNGDWKCLSYQRADGTPLVGGADPTKVPLAGGTMSGALNFAPPVTIASSATVNAGAAASNNLVITGNVTINAFDTIAAGARRYVLFAGTPTLTHNATSFILPTGANMVVVAGDTARFISLGGGNWRCESYTRFGTVPLTASGTDTLTNKTLVNPVITNFTESGAAVSTAAYTVDLSNGTDFEITTTGNLVITLPAPVAGKSYTVSVVYGGVHTVSFAGGGTIKFPNGNAPTPTSIAGKTDVYVMRCNRAGNTTLVQDGGRNF